MNHAGEIGQGGMKYVSYVITIGSGVQKGRGGGSAYTHKDIKLIS
jgi:hypothetical protein